MALSSQRMSERTPQNMRKRKKRGLKRCALLRPKGKQKRQPRIYQSQIRFVSALRGLHFTTINSEIYAYLDQNPALATDLLASIEHIVSLYPQAQIILNTHFQDELVEIDLNVRTQDYADPNFFSVLDDQSHFFIENWNHTYLNIYIDSDLHQVQPVSH